MASLPTVNDLLLHLKLSEHEARLAEMQDISLLTDDWLLLCGVEDSVHRKQIMNEAERVKQGLLIGQPLHPPDFPSVMDLDAVEKPPPLPPKNKSSTRESEIVLTSVSSLCNATSSLVSSQPKPPSSAGSNKIPPKKPPRHIPASGQKGCTLPHDFKVSGVVDEASDPHLIDNETESCSGDLDDSTPYVAESQVPESLALTLGPSKPTPVPRVLNHVDKHFPSAEFQSQSSIPPKPAVRSSRLFSKDDLKYLDKVASTAGTSDATHQVVTVTSPEPRIKRRAPGIPSTQKPYVPTRMTSVEPLLDSQTVPSSCENSKQSFHNSNADDVFDFPLHPREEVQPVSEVSKPTCPVAMVSSPPSFPKDFTVDAFVAETPVPELRRTFSVYQRSEPSSDKDRVRRVSLPGPGNRLSRCMPVQKRRFSSKDLTVDEEHVLQQSKIVSSPPVEKDPETSTLISKSSGALDVGSEESSDEDLTELDDDAVVTDRKILSMARDAAAFQKAVDEGQKRKAQKMRSADSRKSRFIQVGTSGYLLKRGGQKGDKTVRKRWVEFDGIELKYFKDKGGDPLQCVPVYRMIDVQMERETKKPTFHLVTPNRTFTFMEPKGDLDEMTIWVSVLMEAILLKEENDSERQTIGGSMCDPEKEGWLEKQGHNVVQDWKRRYVAIKGDLLCYYRSFEDFKDDLPIHRMEMKLVSLKEDPAKFRLFLRTNTAKTFAFEAESEKSFLAWKAAIETAIQVGLGDLKFLEKITENASNAVCADCGEKHPVWASVNLLVVVCAQCVGCHRFLGQHCSKARSILMDSKVWTEPLVKLFQVLGNDRTNALWQHKLPLDDKISVDCDRSLRQDFITRKYKEKRYFKWSEMFGQPDDLGLSLRKAVVTDDVLETLRLIVSGADVYFVPEGTEDKRTPFELAIDANQTLQMELLRQFSGHLSVEEKEVMKASASYSGPASETPAIEGLMSPTKSIAQPAIEYDKKGLLLVKGPKNDSAWREKMFFLQDRKLYFNKGPKPDDNEIIDLTKVEDLQYGANEPGTFTIVLAKRSYYLRGLKEEEAEDWFRTLRNKQVMGVPVECQECNSSKVPYLIEKCIAYVEANGLDHEGIYRLSGAKSNITKLITAFNQDAKNVRLILDDWPDINAVAGLLKQYLRELPDPLLMNELYEDFTRNTLESEHDRKLWTYKNLIKSLSEQRKASLRCIVLHLNKVVKKSSLNKMNQDNIVMIFGPCLLSNAQSVDQSRLQREYNVLADMLTYFEWLFDVAPSEIKKEEEIQSAIKKLQEARSQFEKVQSSVKISDLNVSLLVNSLDEQMQMKLTSSTVASEACWLAIQHRKLSVDGNWAIFEIIRNGRLERPLQAKEFLLPLVIGWNGADNQLMIKANHVAEKVAPFQSQNLIVSGLLNYRKNDGKWQKNYFAEIKTGNIKVYSKKGSSKEEENISIHETILYIGTDSDSKKKAPGRFGFCLKMNGEMRYFCNDNENEMNMWIGAVLNIRYPSGIWTTIQPPPSQDPSASLTPAEPIEISQHWGRQSTYIRPNGASSRLLSQVKEKRDSLRNVFK